MDSWKSSYSRIFGSAGNIKNRISTGVKGSIAGFKGKEGPQPQQFTGGLTSKVLSILNSNIKKIENDIISFKKDISILGLDPETLRTQNPEIAIAIQTLSSTLNNLKSRLQPSGQIGKTINNITNPTT